MGPDRSRHRRSLRYIRLAAFLAGRPDDVDHLEMSLGELADLVGEDLPSAARYPSWWRNDARRMHARAWLVAGWEVAALDSRRETVLFVRARPKPAGVPGG